MRGIVWLGLLVAACGKDQASELSPHFYVPKCELTPPSDLTRSPSPMPDYIAELRPDYAKGFSRRGIIVRGLREEAEAAAELPPDQRSLVTRSNGIIVELIGTETTQAELTGVAQSLNCRR